MFGFLRSLFGKSKAAGVGDRDISLYRFKTNQGDALELQRCGVCNASFPCATGGVRVVKTSARPDSRGVGIDVGARCSQCRAFRCPAHSKLVQATLKGHVIWDLACAVCGQAYPDPHVLVDFTPETEAILKDLGYIS
jgi:hypothetical protein